MSQFASLALLGWIPISAALFATFKPRRALLFCYLIGWLFLPWDYFHPGGPVFMTVNKMNAVTCGPMVGILLFDSGRLLNFRPRIIDLPMLCWTFATFISSMTNGLGLYDGFTWFFERVTTWTVPYLCGRLYFRDQESLRELAITIFMGGLIYVPLCLFEIRMSPNLHKWVYGIQHVWGGKRLGGYRPAVFMRNGIALGLWMSISALVGLHLTSTKAFRRIFGMQARMMAIGLVIVTIMCRSTGALALFVMGWGTLALTRTTKLALPIVVFALLPVLYVSSRGMGVWSGDILVDQVKSFEEDRAGSLEYRLYMENILAERARESPAFGWGRWGRHLPLIGDSGKTAVCDGLWIIAFGQNGIFGLIALLGVHLVPVFSWLRRVPVRRWFRPEYAAGGVLAISLTMFLIDNLFNAFFNPFMMLAAGGIIAVKVAAERAPVASSVPEVEPVATTR